MPILHLREEWSAVRARSDSVPRWWDKSVAKAVVLSICRDKPEAPALRNGKENDKIAEKMKKGFPTGEQQP
ncbi:MAG TPA: hypothetical protein VL983_02705 [Terriglobales bacterium]|nr:hypothetical protein [Terriglobales bacterium]